MAKKSNKTSHVLNLLSGGGEVVERKPLSNNVTIDNHAKNDPLAEDIKKSLIEDMGDVVADEKIEAVDISTKQPSTKSDDENEVKVAQSEDTSKEDTSKQADKKVNEMDLQQFAEEKAEESEELSIEEAFEASINAAILNTVESADSAPTAPIEADKNGEKEVKRLSDSLGKDDFEFLSVMEYIIEQEIHTYIENFSVCNCSRCMADVMALSLTNLPAKFVVAGKDSVSPILNFYSKKYATEVTVALTNACVQVAEHPHHVRPR